MQDPLQAMIVLGLAGLFNDFVMPAAWAGCMDVGGRYAGTVSGAMNMMGSIAGAISPLVVGYLLAWTSQNWTLTFYVSGAIYMPRCDLLAVPRRAYADGDADRRPAGGIGASRVPGSRVPGSRFVHGFRFQVPGFRVLFPGSRVHCSG